MESKQNNSQNMQEIFSEFAKKSLIAYIIENFQPLEPIPAGGVVIRSKDLIKHHGLKDCYEFRHLKEIFFTQPTSLLEEVISSSKDS